MADVEIPPARDLVWTIVMALRELGGSGRVPEIEEAVVALAALTEEQQAVPHEPGTRTEIQYRLAWARTRGKLLGLFLNPERSIWALTEVGKACTEAEAEVLKLPRERTGGKAVAAELATEAEPITVDDSETLAVLNAEDVEDAWRQQLLDLVKTMRPDAFERLTGRLLREAGFENVEVSGKSGDGGVDGHASYRMSLVTFPVIFQCKRYKATVASEDVRQFRGSMQGRTERGLFVTTGTFTKQAKEEARRAGAPPIDLIDGVALTDLLREHRLGLTFTTREVYDVTLQPGWFADL